MDDGLDQMIATGSPADLVTEFALPVPSHVIALLLGVPYHDHHFFQTRSQKMLDLTASPEEAQAARSALVDYLFDLVLAKEREPGDDLISRLLAERVAARQLTREELARSGASLLLAGHETTANMIALGTLTLLQHPEQLARVRDTDDPQVVAGAVEELLRYLTIAETPVVRVAREDITIGGQLVRAGEGLVFSLSVANQDSAFLGTAPTASTSTGRPAATSPSVTGPTSAWARTWPGRNSRPPCRRCCAGCPHCGSPCPSRRSASGRAQPCTGSRNCRSHGDQSLSTT